MTLVVIVAISTIALFATNTVHLRQARTPNLAMATALPVSGDTVTLYGTSGSPALTFQTTAIETDIQPYPTLDLVRSRFSVSITNETGGSLHIDPNLSFGVVDSWNTSNALVQIDDQDEVTDGAAFDLTRGQSRTIRFRLDLHSTAQPMLLTYHSGNHFAVLYSFQPDLPGVGTQVLTAGIPTQSSSWLAVPEGNLTVTSAVGAASTTDRGLRIWDTDAQTASITLTFTNLQAGSIAWTLKRVTLVDQLGQAFDTYPTLATTGTPTATESGASIPAHTGVQVRLAFTVPLGTRIDWIVIDAGESETVVAASSWGEPNLAYNNDLIAMLGNASANCQPYSDWSTRAHQSLASLDLVLQSDLDSAAAWSPDQLRVQAQTFQLLATDLTSKDTLAQSGFSESAWLASILNSAADDFIKAAETRERDPSISWAVDPGNVSDLVTQRDHFATRLGAMDSFVSTGCGDIVDPSLSPVAEPAATPSGPINA